LDIVPAIAANASSDVLKVPDRPQAEWIDSDPLGYARRLSDLNKKHCEKIVPLIKLVKAWRDVQMTARRPKSYVLEVMVFFAIEQDAIEPRDHSMANSLAQFFNFIARRYHQLMENGNEAPRIADPQLGHFITQGWSRSDFETFMRRVREADRAAQTAERSLLKGDELAASEEWRKVFGDLWPSDYEVKTAARSEAATIRPGITAMTSAGLVVGGSDPMISSQPTRFHGG
jgi:hypothetical protein